ncbi:MAG: TetR/AcrR family transcriptional regulator C-terminal domain-containing protein [Lachnospiraceae bacterium]
MKKTGFCGKILEMQDDWYYIWGEIELAVSNITKKALASALKELMNEKSFEKISVKDICTKCDMSRKSFYYHFKDKYDLANWIFDVEFISKTQNNAYDNVWKFLKVLNDYLYENRDFYRKAMKIRGQNSFSEHFREYLIPIIVAYLEEIIDDQRMINFYSHFFADALIGAIERWITEKECIPPDEFLELMKACVVTLTEKVAQDMNK